MLKCFLFFFPRERLKNPRENSILRVSSMKNIFQNDVFTFFCLRCLFHQVGAVVTVRNNNEMLQFQFCVDSLRPRF